MVVSPGRGRHVGCSMYKESWGSSLWSLFLVQEYGSCAKGLSSCGGAQLKRPPGEVKTTSAAPCPQAGFVMSPSVPCPAEPHGLCPHQPHRARAWISSERSKCAEVKHQACGNGAPPICHQFATPAVKVLFTSQREQVKWCFPPWGSRRVRKRGNAASLTPGIVYKDWQTLLNGVSIRRQI